MLKFINRCPLQVYGQKQIVMEKDEVDEIKKFDDPGLVLIGFKPMSKLKVHHHIRPAVFIYPEEDQVSGQFLKGHIWLLTLKTLFSD